MKKQTPKTATAAAKARRPSRQTAPALPLHITLTLTGETAHVFRAMCARDEQTPVEFLAQSIQSSLACYMEARAHNAGGKAAFAGTISGRESEACA